MSERAYVIEISEEVEGRRTVDLFLLRVERLDVPALIRAALDASKGPEPHWSERNAETAR